MSHPKNAFTNPFSSGDALINQWQLALWEKCLFLWAIFIVVDVGMKWSIAIKKSLVFFFVLFSSSFVVNDDVVSTTTKIFFLLRVRSRSEMRWDERRRWDSGDREEYNEESQRRQASERMWKCKKNKFLMRRRWQREMLLYNYHNEVL